MYRRPFRTQGGELVRVVVGDLGGVEAAHPVGDLLRAGERGFHRNLLIEQHADQQREWVGSEQRIRGRVLGKLQLRHRHSLRRCLRVTVAVWPAAAT